MDEPNVVIEKLELQLDVAGDTPENEFARQLQQHFPLLLRWIDEERTRERIAAADRALGDRPAGGHG